MPDRITSESKPLNAWIRALSNTARLAKDGSITFPQLLDRLADTHGEKPALISEHDSLTYSGLVERSNRYARWALAQNVQSGNVVCLLMPNCPDYVAIWLGIIRIGGVVALVNTNLTGDALAHSIKVVCPQHVIADVSLAPALTEVMSRCEPGIRCWIRGSAEIPTLSHSELDFTRYSGDRLDQAQQRPVSAADVALLIYTSGTTGLPKAANVSHLRLLEWSYWFAGMMNVGEQDRVYNCLPMYHSTGGVVAIGAMLFGGGSVVIRPSFSASRFWQDVTATRCTIFQYIGELCRYLDNRPANPYETKHHLRLCCGNGMRGDVWEEFQRRFRIPQILEFYASTEGNVSLYNCEGKPGSIGRIPAFLAHRFPVTLVKCDETGEPLRGDDGYCIRCAVNEPGEAIGRIVTGVDAQMSHFDGYTDKAASAAKVLRDVFTKGDAWFRTGDLLRRDAAGFFYFLDRIGDTFRWKSENVSTTEVEAVICGCPGVGQAIVYGVAVPGTEGRAGMAAIVVEPDFSLLQLREHLVKCLPEYARPRFVRVCEALQMTGTFKYTKVQFVREGFDPAQTNDDLYFDDRAGEAFVRLTAGLYSAISQGELRL